MMKQKDAVFNAITQVTGFKEGSGKLTITKEQRASVIDIVVAGFKAGKVSLDKTFTDQELKAYTSGLVSNWIRKDVRFNEGEKYVAKNPGSRAGQTDESIKNMKLLLKRPDLSAEDRALIQSELDTAIAAHQAKKANVEINYNALPESLRSKFVKTEE